MSLLNRLTTAIPARERVITAEEVFQLAEAGLHEMSARRPYDTGRRRARCC